MDIGWTFRGHYLAILTEQAGSIKDGITWHTAGKIATSCPLEKSIIAQDLVQLAILQEYNYYTFSWIDKNEGMIFAKVLPIKKKKTEINL